MADSATPGRGSQPTVKLSHAADALRTGVNLRSGRSYHISVPRNRLTLQHIGQELQAIERQQGLLAARRFLKLFDYQQLAALCTRWQKDPDKEQANDPNRHIHPRFGLLPHMQDGLLPEDAREGLFPDDGAGPVQELTRALSQSGSGCAEGAVYDETVLTAWQTWRRDFPERHLAPDKEPEA